MTNEDAEAALLALGGRIEWSNDSSFENRYKGKVEGRDVYRIVFLKGIQQGEPDLFELSYFARPGSKDWRKKYPACYGSLADARRAAEHHAATGKWKKNLALMLTSDPADPEAEKAWQKRGTLIEWERASFLSWHGEASNGPVMDSSEYRVYQEGNTGPSSWRAEYTTLPYSNRCLKTFPNSTQAKFACEQHYRSLDEDGCGEGEWG